MHLMTFIQKGIEIFAGKNMIDESNFGQERGFFRKFRKDIVKKSKDYNILDNGDILNLTF